MFTAWAPVAEAFVATARDFAKSREPAKEDKAAVAEEDEEEDIKKEKITAERRAEWRALLRRLPNKPTEAGLCKSDPALNHLRRFCKRYASTRYISRVCLIEACLPES